MRRTLRHGGPDSLDAFPVTECPQNTFFVDWGSTGMKIYPVHRAPNTTNSSAFLLDVEKIKKPGLFPGTPSATVTRVLDGMDAKLSRGHRGGAIMATAGFRLQPEAAEATWAGVRQWNGQHGLLEACDAGQQGGCRTLKGTEEASYELSGMVEEARRGHTDLGRNFGMLSCGGASIQLGIWGGPEELMEHCVQDLGHLGRRPEEQRGDWATLSGDSKGEEVLFSWLADHEVGGLNGSSLAAGNLSDHMVGGLNEMQARFDGWLEKRGVGGNPCVPPAADAHHAPGHACDELYAKGKPCLVESHGGYITRLNGTMGSSQDACWDSVDAFLAGDEMLGKWSGSSACRGLAAGTPVWGFLTAFHRPGQLGADVSGGVRWRDVEACAATGRNSTSAQAEYNLVLTSTLLTGFLRHIGLNGTAQVRAFEAEVAEEAMRERGLERGWLAEC